MRVALWLIALAIVGGCSESVERGSDAGLDAVSSDGAFVGDGAADITDGSDSDSSEVADGAFPNDEASRYWIHTGRTSALVYFQVGRVDGFATSYVEYGESESYGNKTDTTQLARMSQLHRIIGLSPQTMYHFRMVLITDAGEVISDDRTFTTQALTDAIALPGSIAGPPYVLDQDNATYLLTEDIVTGGAAVEITGDDVTLELDGHTITYGTESSEQVFAIRAFSSGNVVIGNGHIVQGDAAGDYSSAVETRGRAAPIEVFGITTEVHRRNGHTIRLFNGAQDAEIHHNHLYSTVTLIEDRHYPGNRLLWVDSSGPNVSVHDNILTEGAHRGITVSGDGDVEVAYNDIHHHARYVNGYALGCAVDGMKVHHNQVTSTGRGVHLTAADIEFHDNYLDLKGHMTLDNNMNGDTPIEYSFTERMIELHGIKFEGSSVTNAKVFNNTVRIVQHQPDEQWSYVPATPLNISCYNPNAQNEVYNNTFTALTTYAQTRHGGYGDSGEWASAVYLVAMNKGAATGDAYAIYVHDNEFFSNDLFVSASTAVDMTVRIEHNSFTLATDPSPTESHTPFRGIGDTLSTAIVAGENTFSGMAP